MAVDIDSSEITRVLEQLTAQVARVASQLETQREPVAWYRRPIGYGLVGTVLFIVGIRHHELLVPAGLLFICSTLASARR